MGYRTVAGLGGDVMGAIVAAFVFIPLLLAGTLLAELHVNEEGLDDVRASSKPKQY